MGGLNAEARQLAAGAAQRGWFYHAEPPELSLASRWRWHPRFHHPFHGPGLTTRDHVNHVLSGTTRAGWQFWAFQFRYIGGPAGPSRSVAFIYTGRQLPTVSVARRSLNVGRVRKRLAARLSRAAAENPDPRATTQSERFAGMNVGGEELWRRFWVDADDRGAAEWLLGVDTTHRLVTEDTLSLASKGSDILCWCDQPPPSVGTVERMLALLDTIPLPT